jgi:hypothetical protein
MKILANKPEQKPLAQSSGALATAQRPRRRRRRLFVILGVLVLLLAVAGGYLIFRPQVQPLSLPTLPAHLTTNELGLAGWQNYQLPLPAHPLTNAQLPQTPQIDASRALLEDAAGQALIQQGQLSSGLAYLRAAAQSDVENLRYSNDYRMALVNHKLYAEELTYFSQVARQTSSPNTLINLALAYVDQMRTCPTPPDGLVCQAQNSWLSIHTLDSVLTHDPYNVIARFARGLNDLYWPTLMGHLPQAQIDLQYAVALTRPLSSISRTFIPQAYAALGDVFAKDGKGAQARNVWLNGLVVDPNSSLLNSRLAIPLDQLTDKESGPLRGLGVPVDTNLTIFW